MNTSPKQSYREKLLDPRWQRMRLEVLHRDQWACRCCGAEESTLHAHHTFYASGAEGPWDYPVRSIITLCAACHSIEHDDFYGVRNDMTNAVIMAGFLTAAQIERFGSFMSAMIPLDKEEADSFLQSLLVVIGSRNARAVGMGDGHGWDAFIQMGAKK